jgi:signal transduction histidine kinase
MDLDHVTANPNRLTRRFAAAAAVGFVIAATMVVGVQRSAHLDAVTRISGDTIAPLMDLFAGEGRWIVLPGLGSDKKTSHGAAHPAYKEFDATVRRLAASADVLRIRVADRSGAITYSTRTNEIGTWPVDVSAVRRALAGDAATRHHGPESFDGLAGRVQDRWLASTWTPVKLAGETGPVIGAVGVDADVTMLRRAQKHTDRTTLIVAAGVFSAMFLLLVGLVARAERTIRRQFEDNLRLAATMARSSAQNKAQTQFLANMSHELRTPLTAIIGFSEIIGSELKGPLGNSEYKEYAAGIGDSGRHLLDVINDVLDLVRAESGAMSLEVKPCTPSSLLDSVARLLASNAEKAGLVLVMDCPDDVRPFETDGTKLRQVLVNLVSNGIKFTPIGGEIRIAVDQDPVTLNTRFRVIDTGIGMSTSDLALAQTPFGQAKSNRAGIDSDAGGGAGLGLPLSRRFVEVLGGRFAVQSSEGRGTTVTVILPGQGADVSKSADVPAKATTDPDTVGPTIGPQIPEFLRRTG